MVLGSCTRRSGATALRVIERLHYRSQWALVDELILGRQDAWRPGCNWDGVIRGGWWHFRQLLCPVIASLSGSGHGLEQDADVKLPGLKGGSNWFLL